MKDNTDLTFRANRNASVNKAIPTTHYSINTDLSTEHNTRTIYFQIYNYNYGQIQLSDHI